MRKTAIIVLLLAFLACKAANNQEKSKKDTVIPVKENSEIKIKDPSPEFTIQLIQDDDNIVVIVLPILTLILGVFLEKGWEAIKENRKFHKNIKRWKLELYGLIKPLENQANSLKEFNSELKKNKDIMPSLGFETALDCEVFNLLERTELLDYYQKIQELKEKDALEKVNKISANIKATKFYHNLIIEKYNDYKSGRSAHTSAFNQSLNAILLEFNLMKPKYRTLIETDQKVQKHFVNIDSLIKNEIEPYKEKGDFKLFEMKEKFFEPLIAELNEISQNVDAQKIFENSQNCLNQLKGIEREIEYVTTNFNNFKKQLETSKSNFDDLIKSLQ